MFGSLKWLPPNNIPIKYEFFSKRFNDLMAYQQAKLEEIYESEKESALKKETRELTKISANVKQEKHDVFIDKKLRQRLHETSQELRDLKNQLTIAEMTKTLIEQRSNNQCETRSAEHARSLGKKRLEQERLQAEADLLAKKEAAIKRRQIVSETLLKQIEDNKERRQREKMDVFAKREERINMQRQIEAEDAQKNLDIQLQKLKIRDDIIKFKEWNAMHQRNLNSQTEQGEQVHFEIVGDLEEKKLRDKVARTQKLTRQQAKSKLIGQQLLAIEDKKRQHENLLLDLWQREHQVKQDRLFEKELQKKIEERQKTKDEMHYYHMESAMRNEYKAQMKKEEDAIYIRNMKESEKQEQREQQLRDKYESRIKYGLLLKSMMEEKRQRREKELSYELKFDEMNAKEKEKLQRVVNEERMKLINSIPPETLCHLPNNLAQSIQKERMHMEGAALKQ